MKSSFEIKQLWPYWLRSGVSAWLVGRLVGWLAGWLAGWLVDWLAGWLVGWLAGWLVGWLTGWLVGWLVVWLASWLASWSVGWLVGWLAGWLVGWLNGWLVDDFQHETSNMERHFAARGYPQDVITRARVRAEAKRREDLLASTAGAKLPSTAHLWLSRIIPRTYMFATSYSGTFQSYAMTKARAPFTTSRR